MKLSLRDHLKHWGRLVSDSRFRRRRLEIRRLEKLPRYRPTTTSLAGRPLEIVDAASFLEMYEEIWEGQRYRFRPSGPHPYILDGGANVGLSVAFFSEAYPNSEIVAFEPDPEIFAVLERNVRRWDLNGVTLVARALWTSETTLSFLPEGSYGGRLGRPAIARHG